MSLYAYKILVIYPIVLAETNSRWKGYIESAKILAELVVNGKIILSETMLEQIYEQCKTQPHRLPFKLEEASAIMATAVKVT